MPPFVLTCAVQRLLVYGHLLKGLSLHNNMMLKLLPYSLRVLCAIKLKLTALVECCKASRMLCQQCQSILLLNVALLV